MTTTGDTVAARAMMTWTTTRSSRIAVAPLPVILWTLLRFAAGHSLGKLASRNPYS